ncbi:hypothetical protein HUK65_14520 [Rhodobacteraceae bacterium 2376]|uniref:Uncharacterized protein n=1 Tax=Rhabdonatronobacter sediminivivens TaxID=2743469 RepID=A0A7Z0I1G5_9RHOB|nr:hypothetical protein [Rhabdonatronobacter sediminivivens]NYS26206.1 hypothetical protein [Rhabdonatronobacter sediminivivens]
MKITLTPVYMDAPLVLERAGDVLTLNGTAYDFTPLPEGATLPRAAVGCDWLASDVARVDGALQLTLILPHGGHAPPRTLFPAPVIDPPDGPVPLPPFSTSVPTPATEDDTDGN